MFTRTDLCGCAFLPTPKSSRRVSSGSWYRDYSRRVRAHHVRHLLFRQNTLITGYEPRADESSDRGWAKAIGDVESIHRHTFSPINRSFTPPRLVDYFRCLHTWRCEITILAKMRTMLRNRVGKLKVKAETENFLENTRRQRGRGWSDAHTFVKVAQQRDDDRPRLRVPRRRAKPWPVWTFTDVGREIFKHTSDDDGCARCSSLVSASVGTSDCCSR